MGQYIKPPYKRLNRETGKWEWVIPTPVEFTTEKDVFQPVDVKPRQLQRYSKNKKK